MRLLLFFLIVFLTFGQDTNRLNVVPNTTTQGRIQFKGSGTGVPTAPTGSDVNVFQRGGKLLCKDASGNDCWAVTTSGGTDVPLSASAIYVSVKDYGALGDGSHDDTAAIVNALAASDAVFFPCGNYKTTSKITLTTGKSLIGCAPANHWRGTSAAKVTYYGSDRAFEIKPSASGSADTINVINLGINGVNATGTAKGFVIDGSAASAYVEGVYFEGVTIEDFPSYQLYGTGLIFMLSFTNSTFINLNRAATGDHTVFFGDNQYRSQVYFYDCNIGQYAVGKWAVKEELSTRTSFFGGTIFMAGLSGANGSHGVWVNGGLDIYGVNVEGLPSATSSQTAVRYTGSNGANIQGTIIASAIGVELGDPASKSTPAIWAVLSGNIGNNVDDVKIWDGGSRIGTTILSLGNTAPPITVTNLRATVDGVYSDVLWWNFSSGLNIGAMPFTTTGNVSTGPLSTSTIAASSTITGSSTVIGNPLESTSGILRGTGANPILINNHAQTQDKTNLSLRAYSSQTNPFISMQDYAGVEVSRWNKDGSFQIIGVTYANLPSPSNGQFTYCTDCQQANPCASGGSGAFARREAGVWNCAGSGGGGGGTLTSVSSGTGISCVTVGTAVTCSIDSTTVPTFITGSATIDFGSISQNACATSTITVTGAATGDTVAPGWPSTIEAGLTKDMYVSSANTVTVNVCKITSGSVDPASQTYSATIVRHF